MSEEKKALPSPEAIAIRTLQSKKDVLEKQIADIQEQKHLSLVKEIVELRLETGLMKGEEVEAEIKRLSQIPDQALIIIKGDWKRAINKLATRKKLYR